MEVHMYNLNGRSSRTIQVPKIFDAMIRFDLIKKAVLATQSHRFQPQGRDPMAGKRTSAESFGVGFGLSRVPRVKGERYPRASTAAFAPNTVKGRTTHPPRVNKKIRKTINQKEKRKALISAIASTASRDIVIKRGHIIDEKTELPIIVTDKIEKIQSTNEALETLTKIGLSLDIERVEKTRKIRAGKGKRRGRSKKHGVGPLIVIKNDEGIIKATRNLMGVDVIKADKLNVEVLAPGTHPGRLTLWSETAIKSIEERFPGV